VSGRDDRIQLVGIDVGSTTTRIAIADARALPGGAAGRPELGQIEERLRTEPARTPFRGDSLDAAALLALVDGAIAAGGARPGAFFGGGALVTGLAARAPNVDTVVDALRARIGDAVVATAGDPRLEAWLAFHGNAGALSRAAPDRLVLNLDIGGGTTNLALGRAGEVMATGWMWIGARHVEVEPGGHRLVRCSPEAQRTLQRLGGRFSVGEELAPRDVERLLDAWIAVLEGAVTGAPLPDVGGREHERELVPAPLALPAKPGAIDLAFSGGVGGLVYDALAGRALPPTTAYGDLGIELAERIARSPVLAARVLVPEGRGRATVYGLLRHQTQISGATVCLPGDRRCPAGDLPILGSLGPGASKGEIARLVALARAAQPAGAVVVRGPLDGAAVRDLGRALGAALREPPGPAPPAVLVVLLEQNLAKALGGYATEWGRRPLPLIVLDEVLPRGAELVRIGAPRGDLVPLSFFGMGS
jgi:ethanolamine utilization protein EutA